MCRVRGGCGGCHFFPFFVMVMEVGEPGFGEVEDFAMLLIMTSARAPGGGAPVKTGRGGNDLPGEGRVGWG